MQKLWTMTNKEHKTLVTREKYDILQKQIDTSTQVIMEIAENTKAGCIKYHRDQKNTRSYCDGCKFVRICTFEYKKYEPISLGSHEGGQM